jgi:nicotinamidase-related amidase
LNKSAAFITYTEKLVEELSPITIKEIAERVNGIDRVYLVFVDILKGFCETGALSSERVNEMVAPVAQLAKSLLDAGMPKENLIFLNDSHPTDAVEFGSFAPHCIRQTEEAEVVDALKPYYEFPETQRYLKNATNGLFGKNEKGERFHSWLERTFDQGKSLFIVVGDCTDLCIYQNAMGIRLLANEKNADVHVIVSKEHVRTYDLSVEQAEKFQVLAHDADVLDQIFLYHMKLNGIELVSSIS